MKPYFLKGAATAAIALLLVPALSFAQDDQKEQPEKAERPEKRERVEARERTEKNDKKNVQQIIITRKGDKDQKTVIEIKGDKVFVNGKDASKDGDVTVHLNNLNDIRALHWNGVNNDRNFNFDFNSDDLDNNNFSLFSEDANRAMLGVTTDEDEKGAKITAITRESAASKAGLKVGDVITKVGDKKIENADDVAKAVHQHKPGDKVAVSILRDGKDQTITAELGKWKGVRLNNLNATIAPMEPMTPRAWTYNFGGGPKLGLSVQDTDDGKGVKVLSVADESSAAKAGIKEGDIITKINDDEVNSTDEVVDAMSEARNEASVKMDVLRNGQSQTIEVRIPRKLKTTDL